MYKTKLLYLLIAALLFVSCSEDDDDNTSDNPTTYNFDNASYQGQLDRLAQLEAITSYGKSALDGNVLELQKLIDMYENTDGNGGGMFNFESTKQLANKTFEGEQVFFTDQFANLVSASENHSVEASNGEKGYLQTGTTKYLVNEKGIEPIQLIEKGMMGAVLYYQIQQVYLGDDKMNVDNSTNEEGTNYTAMEHHWDEAFGYFGAPTDWPANTEGERFWAKYAQKTNSAVTGSFDSPQIIMDAFIAGRQAISDNDMAKRDEQRKIIKEQLEIITAGTAIHYINGSIGAFSDDAVRCHKLSEAWAFIYALKFGDPLMKKVSVAEVDAWLEMLGTDFWEITPAKLTTLRDEISAKFGFDDFKENL